MAAPHPPLSRTVTYVPWSVGEHPPLSTRLVTVCEDREDTGAVPWFLLFRFTSLRCLTRTQTPGVSTLTEIHLLVAQVVHGKVRSNETDDRDGVV